MFETSLTEAVDNHVYRAIKARVIAYEFAQGRRIIMKQLAKNLCVSTWPVREAMKRLAAEGLVIKAPHKGFIAMTLSEEHLQEQYELTRLHLSRGVERLDSTARRKLPECEPLTAMLNGLNRSILSDINVLTVYTGEVFHQIAVLTGNSAVLHAIDRANDHLYYVRTLECQHLDDVQTELLCICELLLAGQCRELIVAIDDYHDRRVALLPTLLH